MIKTPSFLSSEEVELVKNELKRRRIAFFVSNKGRMSTYDDPYYQISGDAIHYLTARKIVARTIARSFIENQKCPKCKTLGYRIVERKRWWERIYYFGATRVKNAIALLTFFCSAFCYGQSTDKPENLILETGWYYITENENDYQRQLDESEESYYISPQKILGVENIQLMRITFEQNSETPQIDVLLDSSGTRKWAEATQKALRNKLAFILNDKLIYAPTVLGVIESGNFSIFRENYDKNKLEKIMKDMGVRMK